MLCLFIGPSFYGPIGRSIDRQHIPMMLASETGTRGK
jgi:hypothetical protein